MEDAAQNCSTATEINPSAEGVSVPAIAGAFKTSRAYVYKLIQKGMPTSSIEAAMAWRETHATLGVGTRSKGKKSPTESAAEENNLAENEKPSRQQVTGRKRRKKLGTLEASLKASVEVEEQCFEEIEIARERQDYDRLPTLINAYNKAKDGRLETEKRVIEIARTRRELISLDEAKSMLARAWMPLLTRLRAVPRRAAPRANPADDVLAEMVIREEIDFALAEGRKTYGSVVEQS